MIDYSSMNGLEVLLLLLTSREGYFLWGIMGAAIIIWIASLVSDNSEEYSKHPTTTVVKHEQTDVSAIIRTIQTSWHTISVNIANFVKLNH